MKNCDAVGVSIKIYRIQIWRTVFSQLGTEIKPIYLKFRMIEISKEINILRLKLEKNEIHVHNEIIYQLAVWSQFIWNKQKWRLELTFQSLKITDGFKSVFVYTGGHYYFWGSKISLSYLWDQQAFKFLSEFLERSKKSYKS